MQRPLDRIMPVLVQGRHAFLQFRPLISDMVISVEVAEGFL